MELREPLERGGSIVGTRGVETPGEHGLQNQLSRVHGPTETEMTITDLVWVYDRSSAYTLWLLNF